MRSQEIQRKFLRKKELVLVQSFPTSACIICSTVPIGSTIGSCSTVHRLITYFNSILKKILEKGTKAQWNSSAEVNPDMSNEC